MRYFSMFSGIGGFELGIQRAALSFRNGETETTTPRSLEPSVESTAEGLFPNGDSTNTELRGNAGSVSCVGYSEIDKYAIKVYERQFEGEDIRSIQPEGVTTEQDSNNAKNELQQRQLPDNRPDLRNGAEEIQRHSTHTEEQSVRAASKRGHRNYGDATRIDPTDLPDFDLLVGGFPCQAFSIAGKRAGFDDTRGTLFFDIARILKEKRPRHLVLENVKGLLSHDSGRTFTTIIGVLTDLGYLVEWQVLNSKDFGVPQNRERVYIVGHLGNECGRKVFPITSINRVHLITSNVSDAQRIYTTDQAKTLKGLGGGLGAKTGLYAIPVLTPDRPEKRQNGRRFKENGDPSFTLTGQDKHGVYDGMKIRRLTPTECERLQGFPDNWTAGESDTQRYKMCGNAVTVNTVQAVMERLIEHEN